MTGSCTLASAAGVSRKGTGVMMLDIFFVLPSEQLIAFVIGGLIVNFAPGQDVMFATACGIQGGPRVGVIAGLGVGVGVLWHIALAAAGLSALIAAHPMVLEGLRYAGAGYLAWLAVKSWRAGAMPDGRGTDSDWRAFRRGILSNVLNPKPVLFMMAFLPQFVVPAAGPVWQQIVALGLVFAFTGTLVTMLYGAVAGVAGKALARRAGVVNKVAAVMFAGLAAKLVIDS